MVVFTTIMKKIYIFKLYRLHIGGTEKNFEIDLIFKIFKHCLILVNKGFLTFTKTFYKYSPKIYLYFILNKKLNQSIVHFREKVFSYLLTVEEVFITANRHLNDEMDKM